MFIRHYDSPLGRILLAADERGLTGLWFEGQKYFARTLPTECEERETPALADAAHWLDVYFSGHEPDFTPPLHPAGTPFQRTVWALLGQIPYGETTTYGALAQTLATRVGLASMSAQAVGGAVGHNPVSIIVPCHRVVGADGSLTGYAGALSGKSCFCALKGRTRRAFASRRREPRFKNASQRGPHGPHFFSGKVEIFYKPFRAPGATITHARREAREQKGQDGGL